VGTGWQKRLHATSNRNAMKGETRYTSPTVPGRRSKAANARQRDDRNDQQQLWQIMFARAVVVCCVCVREREMELRLRSAGDHD
jgi:hypothetical protein